MRIIEKIEIKYFRSFGEKVEIYDLRDVNIFSGANDSGKSNILRALNLFFSKEEFWKTDFYNAFDFEEDFSKEKFNAPEFKSQKKGKYVEITILFQQKHFPKKVLGEKFWIRKRFYRENRLDKFAFNNKGNEIKGRYVKASITKFLKTIFFQYIPAIRDEKFDSFIKEQYAESLSQDVKQKLIDWKGAIQNESNEFLKKSVEKISEIKDAHFEIPEEIDFSQLLDLQTENGINLKNRGDGVRMKFIPLFLNKIAENKNEKIVIWGFEEPENSLESKNIRELAKSFLDKYSGEKQIFITTHSKEFLSLESSKSSEVAVYRVFKTANESSQTQKFEEGTGFDKRKIQMNFWNVSEEGKTEAKIDVLAEIQNDLGIIDEARALKYFYEKRDIESQNKLKEIEERIKKEKKENEETAELEKGKLLPILLTEGKTDVRILKTAWQRLFKKTFEESGFLIDEAFPNDDRGGADILKDRLRTHNEKRKVCGLFDNDEPGVKAFNGLGDAFILTTEANGNKWKERIGINASAILLFIPSSKNEFRTAIGRTAGQQVANFCIEYHFKEEILQENLEFELLEWMRSGIFSEDEKRALKNKNIKTKDLNNLEKTKENFAKNIVPNLPDEEFESFRPLFEKINKLFSL